MKQKSVTIDGESLTITDVDAIVSDRDVKVSVTREAFTRVQESEEYLRECLKDKLVYGINTGFGPMCSYVVDESHMEQLQENLIRSHAVGMGEPIKKKFVLAAMVVRLNVLVKGYSGVSVELIYQLQEFINQRVIPVVPDHGSVGTSGDLVQSAHIALALMGEGEVYYLTDERQKTDQVMSMAGLRPYKLKAKEGLALINGTTFMTGIGAVLCSEAERLIALEINNGAYSLELAGAFKDSINEKLHELRPHKGQVYVASRMRQILASSKLLNGRDHLRRKDQEDGVHKIDSDIQDVYSFRCLPQIIGPVVDSLEIAKRVIETEMNSVTDNPIVDRENDTFLHGGNFHGDYVAWALDQLKMTITKLSLLAERKINFFLNSKINLRWPPFLNMKEPGLTLGLQGLQFTATSTASRNQTLSFPQYVHSISTNGDNQDVVSMGTDAALILSQVIDNAFIVSVIEMVTLAQATDISEVKDKLSESSSKLYEEIRKNMPAVIEDREIHHELEELLAIVKSDKMFDFRHAQ